MKKRNITIIAGIFVALIIFFITKVNKGSSENREVTVEVQRGIFRSEVTASGELFAKKSVKIMDLKVCVRPIFGKLPSVIL